MGKELQTCVKCGQLLNCDDHHILPFKIFGDGTTAPLCKTCHDKYHRFLGFIYVRKKHAQPAEFYLQNWAKWISIVLILVGLAYYFRVIG